MTEHTPGPWTLDKYGLTILCDGWRAYPTKKTICTVRPYPRTTEARNEGRANAKLLVEAPALLDALRRLLSDSQYKDHPEASQMAINAIVAATGKHPGEL